MTSASVSEELIHNLTKSSCVPLVFKEYVNNWSITRWRVDQWVTLFGNREIPFRCYKKDVISDEPCWERKCGVRNMTFKQFMECHDTSDEWMYFDYKYVPKWFGTDTDLFKEISWKQFGYDKGATESTLWVGSNGAHTPAHQDTYGYNIVAQIHGKKRWILFPPETGGLQPTRIPYEESSVYSQLNFYCPRDLDAFKGLTGGRVVELSAGDALLVPCGWWHYVQNMDPLNISLNVWLPHEKDASSQVSEALIKLFVAQICKHLPEDTTRLIVNPNEDDLVDTPLAVLFLQLDTVAKKYLEKKRKVRRIKRQKTMEEEPEMAIENDALDLKTILDNKTNCIEPVPTITNSELIKILRENLDKNPIRSSQCDEVDGITSLGLTKAVIDAFSQPNVIDIVKQNLFARLH